MNRVERNRVKGGQGGQQPPPPPDVLVPKLSLAHDKKWSKYSILDVFEITYDVGDFSTHILGSQTTQELYLRSAMKQDPRNNCLFDLLSQKPIADTLDIVKIAKRFPCAKEKHKGHAFCKI